MCVLVHVCWCMCGWWCVWTVVCVDGGLCGRWFVVMHGCVVPHKMCAICIQYVCEIYMHSNMCTSQKHGIRSTNPHSKPTLNPLSTLHTQPTLNPHFPPPPPPPGPRGRLPLCISRNHHYHPRHTTPWGCPHLPHWSRGNRSSRRTTQTKTKANGKPAGGAGDCPHLCEFAE